MSSSGRTAGDGPVALVTGGGGGIGGAVVRAFAAAGHRVLAVDRFGPLDVVACAHGGSGRWFGDGPVDACSEEGWDATLDLNLRSVFLVCRAAVPALRAAGGGAIVTVASVLGLVGGDRDFATHAYAASKGGLIALTRAMAVSARAQDDAAIRARLSELQPLTGEFGRPEDVAEAVLHLATTRFATGSVLTVDGGWTAR